jgi:glycosyltransferase involved in cell wall biosynthesis
MKVSVVMTTYNHAPFVEQAIESVLVQHADFGWELVVSDDASTDGTRQIIERYARAYPDRIQAIFSEKNINDNSVFSRAWDVARGEYVAVLDGDDYWTSADKLAVQVEFLDHHADCTICFHGVYLDFGPGRPHEIRRYEEEPTYERLLEVNFIATVSSLIRKTAIPSFPPWYRTMRFGDWPIFLLAASSGSIAYLDLFLAAYRVHGGGAWSGLNWIRKFEEILLFQEEIRPHLEPRYLPLLDRARGDLHLRLARHYRSVGDIGEARRHLSLALRLRPVTANLRDRDVARLALVTSFPSLTRLRHVRPRRRTPS